MRRSLVVRVVVSALAALTLVACSGSKSAKSTPTTAKLKLSGAADIVFRSAAKTAAEKTTKVDVSLLYASFPGATGPVTVKGLGAFDLKNKQGTLHLDLSPLFATLPPAQRQGLPTDAGSVDVVFDKSIFFLKAPVLTSVAPTLKPWLKIDVSKASQATGLNLGQLQQLGGGNDPGEQLAVLLGTTDATVVGPEDIAGTPTTHYHGNVDLTRAVVGSGAVTDVDRFKAFVDQLGNKKIPVDVWLDDAGRTRRLKIDIASKATSAVPNPPAFTVMIDYHDFGALVKVTDPPADQVTDLIELSKKSNASTSTTKK